MAGVTVKYLLRLAVVFAVYFVTARIGLTINAVNGFAAAVWPPTGIALATTFLFGYRIWPGILLAAFLVNYVSGAPLFVALGIGVGNTLEALAGAHLLKRFTDFRPSLERTIDVLGLVLFAAILSTCISATVGVVSLVLGNVIETSAFGVTWAAWWVGDCLGVLVMASLIFVWSSSPRFKTIRLRHGLEAVVATLVLLQISSVVFQGLLLEDAGPITFGYLLFPILVWIVLRFNQRGGVTALFLMSVIAIWSTIVSTPDNLSKNLLILQSFTGITAVTFMMMAAVVAERESTLRHKQKLEYKTRQLVRQRQRLESLNQTKDEFISIASHQLRTPATAVKLYIGMALDGFAGKLNKSSRQLLSTAYANNELQLKIINELLSVAQIDNGRIDVGEERVNLTTLVRTAIRQQSASFMARNQKISFKHSKGDFVIRSDKIKMSMVLENILDNASKYSEDGTKIEVRLSKTSDTIHIAIADEGIGIKAQDRVKLFKKFSRINNKLSANVSGTGLGLYWAKKIIDSHSGSITVDSKFSKGSIFTINLPVEK